MAQQHATSQLDSATLWKILGHNLYLCPQVTQHTRHFTASIPNLHYQIWLRTVMRSKLHENACGRKSRNKPHAGTSSCHWFPETHQHHNHPRNNRHHILCAQPNDRKLPTTTTQLHARQSSAGTLRASPLLLRHY